MKRRFLGRVSGAITRQRVYRTDDALEIDDVDHYEVTRRRVFFDDVLLVTQHRFRGTAFLVVTGIVTLLAAGSAVLAGRVEPVAGFIVFGILGLPFLLAFLLRALIPFEVITVYGRRSRARMHFWLNKKKGRDVFAEVTAAIGSTQRRLAAQPPARAAESEIPMPPGME